MKTRLTWKKSTRRHAREAFVQLAGKFWPTEYTPSALVIQHERQDTKVAWLFLFAGVFSNIEGVAE